MKTTSIEPLRQTMEPIRNTNDLRRIAGILAQHFGLPHAPTVKVGYVPWKGPSTPIIDLVGGTHGHFTIARWAVRGRHRRAPEDLEYQLVCAVGFWLDSHRRHSVAEEHRPGLFDETGTNEVLTAWYGPNAGKQIIATRRKDARTATWALVAWIGLLLLVSVFSWVWGHR